MSNRPMELKTEIHIEAQPSKIWEILMEFKSYPDWNPFIKSIKGRAEKGARITARLEPPDSAGITIKPKILEIKRNKDRHASITYGSFLFAPGQIQ